MLAEERFSKILSIIEIEGSATMQELMAALDASESTVRRDLNTMDDNGLLTRCMEVRLQRDLPSVHMMKMSKVVKH